MCEGNDYVELMRQEMMWQVEVPSKDEKCCCKVLESVWISYLVLVSDEIATISFYHT